MEEGGSNIGSSVAPVDDFSGGLGADIASLSSLKISGFTPEMIQTLLLVHTMQADILCQRSKSRKCGYIIQPRIWFLRFNDGIKKSLASLGLEPKKKYSAPEEITRILHVVRPFKWLLRNPKGYEMVQQLNGVLKQPHTHEEVLEALALVDKTYESL